MAAHGMLHVLPELIGGIGGPMAKLGRAGTGDGRGASTWVATAIAEPAESGCEGCGVVCRRRLLLRWRRGWRRLLVHLLQESA